MSDYQPKHSIHNQEQNEEILDKGTINQSLSRTLIAANDFNDSSIAKINNLNEKQKEAFELEEDLYLYKIPPDFNECEKHIDSTYLKDYSEIDSFNIQKCRCCNEPFGGSPFNICTPSGKFANYGLGVSLYFSQLCYYLIISAGLFVVSLFSMSYYVYGGYSPFVASTASYIQRLGGSECQDQLFGIISIGNIEQSSYISIISSFNVVWMAFFVILWGFVRIRLYNENNKLNENLLDPSDYTLSLTGFPIDKSFNEEEFLYQVITKEFGQESISRFVFIYDISDFLKYMNQLSQLKTDKATIERYRRAYKTYLNKNNIQVENLNNIYPKRKTQFLCFCEEKYQSLENIETEIALTEKEINNFVTTHHDELERISKCYVTLKTPHLLDQIIEKYSSNFWEIISRTSKIKYKGKNIYIQKVPEPEDIIFENLQSSPKRRLLGGLLTMVLSFILLSGCFVANYYILQLSKSFNTRGNFALSYLITFASSMCIVAINMIFNKLMPLFCLFEKSHTKTSYNYSVAMKLSIALFLNNAIIPLIAQSPTTYFREGGLLYSIWLNWIMMAAVPGLLEIFNFTYFYYLVKKKCVIYEGRRSTLTQIEANKSLEPVSIYIPTIYSDSAGLLLYTAFYICFFPAGILLTIGGILFNYLIDKILVLYRYRKPEKISGNIALRSMGLIGYGCLACFVV